MKKQILFICCAVIAYCLSACNTAPQQVPLKREESAKACNLDWFRRLERPLLE